MEPAMRERLMMAGLTEADIAWFDAFNCDDARVPKPRADEIADYRRREAGLNASIAALTFSERGESGEGRLAAAIGARVADAQDEIDSEAEGGDGED
ncbi:hypothetical protein K9U39_13050 [Rhodoblastus acidophilus]|uniref:Uncharacterized protein n=1 Tax=Candidatus Rhodoblastus alkanivorans TaxID=2954117 RepID=A0ABS9ZAE1_9HYPH|nr:hypothetical protein [Candidatus Rhodoblastus alkanivorans]MCI4677184.1 hypothetical protein [Candidatus Rhodoblastus alkanivorans]MCI4684537.1 hypothetical protein [Candidatus Rhodoblastus alkanivorans]MDI4641858.1 hypothetical protein [Rhodoblastus acidophilus]